MTIERTVEYLAGLVEELRKLPKETEWLEFKHDNVKLEDIGEYISALANSSALLGKINAYILWGIDDRTHSVIGTNFSPFPKNLVIANFFREIGRADELGSGVRNINKYGVIYGKKAPQLIEGDVFKMIVSYDNFENILDEKVQAGVQATVQVGFQVESQSEKILSCLREQPFSARELLSKLKMKVRTGAFRKTIKDLLNDNLIEYTETTLKSSKQKYRITEKGKKKLKSRK